MRFYKCKDCENVMISLGEELAASPVCCGEQMEELIPRNLDAGLEKHVPYVSVNGRKVTVSIGEEEHPMLSEQHIACIILETKEGFQKKALRSGRKPFAEFMLTDEDEAIAVYKYCSVHGLWRAEIDTFATEERGMLDQMLDSMGM